MPWRVFLLLLMCSLLGFGASSTSASARDITSRGYPVSTTVPRADRVTGRGVVNGRIVYESDWNSASAVYAVDPADPAEPAQLVSSTRLTLPAPNGRQIAYVQGGSLVIAGGDGRAPHEIR